MYIKPQEYVQELKNRINELKAELAEIEPVYEALLKANVTIAPEQTREPVKPELSVAQKIAEMQKERHKKERDAKVPFIVNFLKQNGQSSLAKLSRGLHMTTAAIKRIVEENESIFQKNKNQLWELKN